MYLYQYLVIATAALLPTYLLRFTVFGVPTNFLELMIILCSIAALLEVDFKSLKNIKKINEPLILVGLFLVASLVSVTISPHLNTSLGILKGWIILPMVFGACVYVAADNKKVFIYVIQALIFSGTVMALLGISQIGVLERVKGIYDVPNSLALFLAPLVVIAVWSKGYLNKYLAGVMGIALLGTQSVSGIAAVLLTLLLGSLLWSPAAVKKKVLSGLFIVLLIAVSYLSITDRLSYLVKPLLEERVTNSVSVRYQLWIVSLNLIQENPLIGIGLGVFEPRYQEKLHQRFQQYERNLISQKPISEFVFRDPHNFILSFWLNTGLLGLVSFLGLNIWIFGQAYSSRKRIDNMSISLILSLLTILIFGLADTIYWKNDLATYYWVLIGLVVSSLCWLRR